MRSSLPVHWCGVIPHWDIIVRRVALVSVVAKMRFNMRPEKPRAVRRRPQMSRRRAPARHVGMKGEFIPADSPSGRRVYGISGVELELAHAQEEFDHQLVERLVGLAM